MPTVTPKESAAEPLRVLLVDDCPTFLGAARRYLAVQPRLHVVGAVASAAAAMRLIETLAPQLILMDVAMPEMSGIEATRAIKRLPHAPKVVMLSLHDSAEYRQHAREAGADGYVVKSEMETALAATLHTLFGESGDQAALLQRALSASDIRFRATFEQAAVGIAHVAPDGHWILINRKLCDIVGYPREELYGKTFQDITHPDDLAADLDYVRRMLAGELSTYEMEKRYYRKDGSIVWVNLTVSLVRTNEGAPDYFISVIEDISARHDAAQHLLEREELLRAVIDGNPKCIMLLDSAGKIRELNPAGFALLGNPEPQTVIGKAVAGFIAPADRESAHAHHESTLRGNAGCFEYEIVDAAGESRRVESHAVPLTNPTTGEAMALCISFDVTESRRVEQEHRKLASAIEQAADSIVITDADGTIEYVNDAFSHTSGYAREEAIDHKPNLVRSNMHGDEFYEHLWHTIRSGEVFRAVFINRRKDGALYHEEKSITPLKNAAGAITHFVSAGKDITESVLARESLSYLTHYDTLTGLPNRVLFTDRLQQAMIECRRRDRLLGVACIDLDRFKNINDSLGHELGNAVLVAASERVISAMRPSDTVARFGGDEFVVLLADMDRLEDAPLVAQRILNAFQQPIQIGDHELFVEASIGIALYPTDHAEADAETLLRNADTALYRAKASGGASCQFYAAEMTRQVEEDMALESALRHAIEHKELSVHYQPIVHLGSGRIVSAEALLRWRHPVLGNVSPARFIPIAEESGLIIPIGEWVLRQACAQVRAWRDAGYMDLHVAVNLSPRQFRQPALVERIKQLLDEAELEGVRLELEITEGMLMTNIEDTLALMRQFDGLGVSFAVDDFGTGYSSLSYLKRFPIQVLKIDQSFVRDITSDADDAAIVRAIITLAHSLGMTVVAEGVETAQQVDFLRANDCDTIQGYYIARPDAPETMTRLLEKTEPLLLPKPAAE